MESNNAKCIDELRAIKDSIECCLLQQVRKGDVDIDALEIDPYVDLRNYGLDSVAVVSLVGVWRAHGDNIRYEDVRQHPSLHELAGFILQSSG